MSILFIIYGYMLCCFFAWGLALGYFTYKYPDQKQSDILIWCIGGPISLIAILIYASINQCWQWRIEPLSAEQRFEHFKKMYPNLDRDYFESRDR